VSGLAEYADDQAKFQPGMASSNMKVIDLTLPMYAGMNGWVFNLFD
jgi:hypothetical protein